MGVIEIIGAIVIIAIIAAGAYGLYQWLHYGTWTQPNDYTGVVSSFTHYVGVPFHKIHYKVEFIGGSNVSFPSEVWTLEKGFVAQPVNVSKYKIKAGENCTFDFNGSFLENLSCG